MIKHDDERDIHKDLRRLLVALVLGDASDAELDRLNNLLRRDVELRRRTARFLEEEAVLRHELQILDRVGDYHTRLPHADETLLTTTACGASARQRASKRSKRRLAPILLLASALVVAIGSGFWAVRHTGQLGAGLSEEATGSMLPGAEHRSPGPLALATSSALPRVTRVSWSGPQFASGVGPAAPAGLHEGVVPFTSVRDRPAQGYMVHLPPDALLDLVVAADAEGENSLAVIEFDSDGTPTGRRISFSNSLADAGKPAVEDANIRARTRFGPIGTWVERNNSPRSKYYCFTSVHKLLNRTEDDSWHVSRLSVLLEGPDLAHIGWDDSGMMRLDKPDDGQKPDLDYDDISATIRIYRPGWDSDIRPHEVRVVPGLPAATTQDDKQSVDPNVGVPDRVTPPMDESQSIRLGPDSGLPLSVGRHEAVFVKVTNRFRTPTTISLVDENTGQVWWSCDPSRATSSGTDVCAVKNTDLDARRFRVVGRRRIDASGSNDAWRELKPSLLFEQEAFVSFTLDEGPDDADFDDVKVDVVTMKPL